LPTEAEWEYSCRGGASLSKPFHFGDSLASTQANFNGGYPYGGAVKGPYLGRPCPTGSYCPNVFGLFDMHGNVWEWCLDWYDLHYCQNSPERDPQSPDKGDRRVLRGGSWGDFGINCRSARRISVAPGDRSLVIGFRVCCVLDL
jgi:formylglycine-generating enzyme required for sulfatase activity